MQSTWQRAEVQVVSMNPVTTQNPPCVKTYSTRSKPVERVESQDSGQLERLKCSPKNTKQKVEATSRNESPAEVLEKLDQAEVAYQKWQALYTRPQSYRGAISP